MPLAGTLRGMNDGPRSAASVLDETVLTGARVPLACCEVSALEVLGGGRVPVVASVLGGMRESASIDRIKEETVGAFVMMVDEAEE